jgi:hypothetical protein
VPATQEVETQQPVAARRTYIELPPPEPAALPASPEPEKGATDRTALAASPRSPTAPTDPEPATADPATPEIEEHLRLASQALDDYRLMVPREDSAYYHYQQVLQRDPDNAAGLQGLTDIAERYADLAEKELDQFHYPTARRYLQRGLTVQPGNQRLLALSEQTDALKDSPKRLIGKLKSLFE